MRRQPFSLRRRAGAFTFALLATALLVGPAAAQPQVPAFPSPKIYVVSPAGGKAGSSFEVSVYGQDIENADNLLFSQPGIKAEPSKSAPPPPPDPKKKQPGPKIGPLTISKFKVTIPAGTLVGIHDVRLVNKWGVSNPRAFVVGDLVEVLEREPNNDDDTAQRVQLNTTINGVINTPLDVDYFVFSGKKGQRVVLSCLTSSIDSLLQPEIHLYDSKQRELAQGRNYHGNDALLDCTLPGDGDYYVRVCSFAYTVGDEKYFYRLSISTAPWIDAVFPNVVEPGKQAKLTIYGRNLPGGKADPSAVIDGRVLEKITVTVDVPKDATAVQRLAYNGHLPPVASSLDGFEYRVSNSVGSSNPALLTFAKAPVVLEAEPNDTPATAQEIKLPCEIAGRIDKKGDRDWYVFQAKKGDVYSIEVYGDRLGSPLDMYFVLQNAETGKAIVEMDDNPEVMSPQFFARTEDPPRYRFVVPADGKYRLLVSSREAFFQSGPRHFYRVRITPEHPDFRLVVMPASPNTPDACILSQGGHQLFTVFVWRLDGFNSEITLTAADLPEGVTCPPQTIAATAKQASLVVSASGEAPLWTGQIKVLGTATINGRKITREARSATISWPVPQVNLPTLSRLDRSLVLAVRDKAPFALLARLEKTRVFAGEKISVPVKVVRNLAEFKGQVVLVAVSLPPELTMGGPKQINLNGDKGDLVLTVKPNTAPGTYTAVLRGQGQFAFNKDPKVKNKGNILVSQALPPITVTVLPKQLAKISVTPANATVKLGNQTEVTVKLARLYDYQGEFKVALVLPPGVKGVSSEEVTIPAGKDTAKLVVEVDPDAGTGPRNLTLRATTLFEGNMPITHDAKLNINVVK
jgi:hypothetical protein